LGGRTVQVHEGEDLQAILNAARPNETILLQAGAVFVGNFILPDKRGSGWIYIESFGIGNKIRPGQRVTPADAPLMAKIETPTADPAISVQPGAGHYRLVGLEIAPTTGAPRVYSLLNIDPDPPAVGALAHTANQAGIPQMESSGHFPQNITIDRCYIHAADTQDVRDGVVANGTFVAVIDSFVSDIHDSTYDSQAILINRTPGPLKIVNNFLSATAEDMMCGGGDPNNSLIPSDIEIRNNHFFKPMAWDTPGLTLPPNNKWVVKNNLALKNARRVIVAGNIFENNWMSGQVGFSVLLTVRTSQSGNTAVVEDITIENNVLRNVVSGFDVLSSDNTCGAQYGHPGCTNPGEERRIRISNNLILFANPNGPGGTRNVGLALHPETSDLVFEHNTLISYPESTCDASIFFVGSRSWPWPPPWSYTHNIWILDNVLCRPPSGDWAREGVVGLTYYMGDPPPLDKRFLGNVMYDPPGYSTALFPHKNTVQSTLRFANISGGNYNLVVPQWTETSDGMQAGVIMYLLKHFMGNMVSK
jgi:hypothetical protein